MRRTLLYILCVMVIALLFYGVVDSWKNDSTPQTASAATVSATQVPSVPSFDSNTMLQKNFRFGYISQGTRLIDLELGIVCYSDTNSIFCLNLTPEQLAKIGDR